VEGKNSAERAALRGKVCCGNKKVSTGRKAFCAFLRGGQQGEKKANYGGTGQRGTRIWQKKEGLKKKDSVIAGEAGSERSKCAGSALKREEVHEPMKHRQGTGRVSSEQWWL